MEKKTVDDALNITFMSGSYNFADLSRDLLVYVYHEQNVLIQVVG